jgi:hypothetical protein
MEAPNPDNSRVKLPEDAMIQVIRYTWVCEVPGSAADSGRSASPSGDSFRKTLIKEEKAECTGIQLP